MKSQFRKFGAFYITEAEPNVGDRMVCIQRKNVNYGCTTTVKVQIPMDLVNWKVCITREQAEVGKELLADAKQVQKEFKKINVHWELDACLDSVIEKRERVVFPRVKEYALSKINK